MTDIRPPDPKKRRMAQNKDRVGLVLVHTGDGKGKSTSAFGLALRAVGHGMRVHIVQFIKGSRDYGELASLAKLGVTVERAGEGFTWEVRSDMRQQELAAWGMERARAAIGAEDTPGGWAATGEEPDGEAAEGVPGDGTVADGIEADGADAGNRPLDVLILDEVNIALGKGFFPVDVFLAFLASRPPDLHVVCTGRYAPDALLDAADLVTHHELVKHPFQRGVRAQPGVEF